MRSPPASCSFLLSHGRQVINNAHIPNSLKAAAAHELTEDCITAIDVAAASVVIASGQGGAILEEEEGCEDDSLDQVRTRPPQA